jgi:hypothetical protein
MQPFRYPEWRLFALARDLLELLHDDIANLFEGARELQSTTRFDSFRLIVGNISKPRTGVEEHQADLSQPVSFEATCH